MVTMTMTYVDWFVAGLVVSSTALGGLNAIYVCRKYASSAYLRKYLRSFFAYPKPSNGCVGNGRNIRLSIRGDSLKKHLILAKIL